jgi:hypothetical protein
MRSAILLLVPSLALAQPAKETPLLEDDLQQNKRTKIDGAKDSFDSALDDALGGPSGFSTKELEKIEDRMRAELKRDRPRATPRLIMFLYPGRIDKDKLKRMSEVLVDIELVMDPCERNVCREAVAKHIELVGRAIGQPTLSAPGYKLTFKQVTLKTSTTMHDTELMVYQIPIPACIAASQKSGGGMAWLSSQDKAEQDYEPIVMKAIQRRANERRVSLGQPPKVLRSGGSVEVSLMVKGDRARVQQQAMEALGAAEAGLRDNPKTPPQTALDIAVETDQRGAAPRRFRSQGSSVGLWLDGKLSGGDLWANYVEEVKKQPGAQRMGFDDAEARGGDLGGGGEPDDNEALAVVGENFAQLAACAKAEAVRTPGFRGVTVTFKWTPSGQAEGVEPKEPALKSKPIAGCLRQALSMVRLPRFSGGPRVIEYPIKMR